MKVRVWLTADQSIYQYHFICIAHIHKSQFVSQTLTGQQNVAVAAAFTNQWQFLLPPEVPLRAATTNRGPAAPVGAAQRDAWGGN